ncbi:MAG: hypothetical protein ACJ786_28445, partial [Catenulispora sp.]
MSKNIRTALVGLTVSTTIAAGILGGTGVSQAARTTHSASAAPVDSGLARQNAQLVVIEHLRAIAAAAPDRFAGVSTQGSAHVEVNLADNPSVSPSSTSEDVASITREAAAVGITISFPVRKHSLRELTRIQDAV